VSAADNGRSQPIKIPHDLHGRRKDRVWYAEVLLLFRITLWNDALCSEEEHDLAWIQWYEALGMSNTDTFVHKDPEFPESLGHHFPRIYLPEPNLRAAYYVILVQNIIAPAPVCDDVSLVRVSPTPKRRGKQGSMAAQAKVVPSALCVGNQTHTVCKQKSLGYDILTYCF
jgi:hypothetical protein